MQLGQILVRKKKISYNILEQMLKLLQSQNYRLGEFLIEQGLITHHDLEDALKEQYFRNKGLWIID